MVNAGSVIKTDLDYMVDRLADEFAALAGKKLLITGGAGFLGYYLVQSALHWNSVRTPAEAICVTVFDNFMRGKPDWVSSLESDDNFEAIVHDLTVALPQGMPAFQYIIHAASIASPHYYRKYPIETMDANVNGLRFLLEYCREWQTTDTPVEGFMFYSTSEIYGDPDPQNIPTPEDYRGNVSCTGPRACYDESKRYGETLCVNFARQHDLPVNITRPFNNYGPGLKITDKRVIPDFARDILSDQDVVMFSDGSPTRTFCYIADAVVGHYKVLVRGRPGESYNIGIDEPEISMLALAECMVEQARSLFGYQGKIVTMASEDKDYLVDNPNRRCPDISKARSEFGYEPGVSLDDGLRRSLFWYKENCDVD